MGTSEGRGGGCGYGGARRRRRLRSARVRGRGQRGESHGESERGPEGLRGALSQLQAVGGKQEVASYGHARVGHALRVRLARGGRRLALARWAGPAGGAGPGKWPRYVSFLSLFLFVSVF